MWGTCAQGLAATAALASLDDAASWLSMTKHGSTSNSGWIWLASWSVLCCHGKTHDRDVWIFDQRRVQPRRQGFLQLAFQAQPTAVSALAHPQTCTTPSLR